MAYTPKTWTTGETITAAELNALEQAAAAAQTAADVAAASTADRARANHTGTQSADTLTDGTANKAYTATERTKLSGVATGATANSTDAQLRDRSTHTGTQAASTVTGLSAVATSGAYTDLSGKPTIPTQYTDAQAQAANATALAGKADLASGVVPDAQLPARLSSATLGAAFIAQLGASNGTDDTATINAALAGGGKIVRGVPGQTYLTSAPLVIPSRTVLDMAGCTVLLKSAANCNMLQNAAVGAVRRVLDAATTAASTTVTSATAAFTSGDVGKAITIQQAATNGAALTTTIASVTNSTTAVLAAAATVTTTGQYAAIGTRDTDITVRGGYWNRQDNNSNPANSPDSHTLRFRHVDKLTVTGLEVAATGGKYAINPGDCTDIRVTDVTFRAQSSDGVHLNGPCARAEISNVIGDVMGDDIVSLTARDTFAVITDCAGDITDVTVDNVMYRAAQGVLTSSALKIVAGQNTTQTTNYKVARVIARSLVGPASTQSVVSIGDVFGGVGGNGGTFTDITVDGVRSLGGGGNTQPTVNLNIGSFDGITLRDVRSHPDDLYAVQIGSSATVDRLLVDGLRWDPAGSYAFGLVVFGSANRVTLRSAQANLGPTGNNRLVVVQSGATLSRLVLDGAQVSATADGEIIMNGGGTLTSVHVVGGHFTGISYPLGTYRDGTVLTAHSVHATGTAGWLQVLSGANTLTVAGVSGLFGDKAGYTLGSGAAVRVLPRGASGIDPDPDMLASGEETLDRRHITDYNSLASGNLVLTYFTARKTETINNVRTQVTSPAAAGTTIARVGIYLLDGSGTHTLVASTANDTTLWNGTYSGFTKALTAPWAKVAGQRYALGVLFVGTTGPALRSILPANGSEDGQLPRINGNLSGQTDLPASFGAPSTATGVSVYAALTP